ncbi:endothelin-converting enzyme/putative endopeptidase [Azospirillum sp. RU38E]|nr:endothelin-converting enzyme/putative endopeptidase [Azospirillum sp. RU38E]SNS12772.1 endothelin-converting enzyme/putative endopeptidase [Azospirillum sp. RU37A]
MKLKGLRSTSQLGAIGLALLVGLTACTSKPTRVAEAPAPAKPQPPAPGLPVLDPTVSPCDNFYLHACGVWMKENPIPADQSRWGTFQRLADQNQGVLRTILDDAVANPKPETAKIAAFYAACMDEAAVEAKGLAPLQPTLSRIDALRDKQQLGALVGTLHDQGIGAFFSFSRMQKFSDAVQTIAVADQGGLGLPDRDFYFKDDAKSKEQRAAYLAHVTRMFTLAGDAPATAAARANIVMVLETKLADASMTRVERRDPNKRNNPTTFKAFAKKHEGFDWAAYVKASGAPAFTDMNVGNPGFFKSLEQVLKSTPLDELKTYLRWQTLRAAAPWLPKAMAEENFDFYGRTLSGTKEQRPRWKRCVAATDSALGEDLGKYFVAKTFGPQHKARMQGMVNDLLGAFNDRFGALDWMGAETQVKAREKLGAIATKIGYPEKWQDYTALTVTSDDLLGNVFRAAAFDRRDSLSHIGKPRDPSEWGMTPPTVNAYYSPQQNNINFPAGILQPPFFDFSADDAYNYGAIGAVIGHEITHGFDDQGRKYAGDGNLSNWWTEDDGKKFEEKAQCLVDQYGGYTAVEGVNLNGKQTLGENTADNGGLSIALAALKKHLGPKVSEKIGGLTAEQRAFYGWAHIWCSQSRPEARRLQALTDPHSLPEFRVNGTVSNMKEFAAAFNCKPTDPMVRGDKACKVW